MPTTVAFGGTLSTTTALAPTRQPSFSFTAPMILAPAPMKMSLPSVGL
ncbi:MAG TPA: hypothetical protein VKK61_09980 [Tepidisphaeraceae bacterium]|nr:hypothetical protein [Tepidisphaeraceae bacterium]